MDEVVDDCLLEARGLINEMRSRFKGQEPGIIGAVLGELSATFIASHAPHLRDQQYDLLCALIKELVPVIINGLIAEGIVGPEWKDDDKKLH